MDLSHIPIVESIANDLEELLKLSVIWKTEGGIDTAALKSCMLDAQKFFPHCHQCWTNGHGAGESPIGLDSNHQEKTWCFEPLRDKIVYVVHDCDKPGQSGALEVVNGNGRSRPGWAPVIAQYAHECRNIVLPSEIAESKGEDLEDFLEGILPRYLELGYELEKARAHSYLSLLVYAQSQPIIEPCENADCVSEVAAEDTNVEEVRYEFLFQIQDESGQTDLANAKRFIDHYHRELLFVAPWKRWLSWDGTRWHDDSGVGVRQKANEYARDLWHWLPQLQKSLDKKDIWEVIKFVKSSSSSERINAFIRLASSDPRVVCQINELDHDQFLLNVLNGTVDLRLGQLRPHDPNDRITQLAPVEFNQEANCPKWLETIHLVTDGDVDLASYLQELLGYSIAGHAGEAILPIVFGDGNNGKSTVWNTVEMLLGDYSVLANDSLLIGTKDTHPTDKALLYRKRFVPISEPERDGNLREGRLKELTGEHTITARRVREDFWSFSRTHTFWMSTNHLPKIKGTDDGIWRRIKVIPFTVDISKKVSKTIKSYHEYLVETEGSGILNWLLAGWLRYQERGDFVEPAIVRQLTAKYRIESDTIGQFLAAHCVEEEGAMVTAKDLFNSYENDGGKESSTAFGRAIGKRFHRDKPTSGQFRGTTVYFGIRLRDSISNDNGKSTENFVLH